MIIGVTGLIGSGKGAVTDILVKKGFIHLGCSNIIAEEVKRRGLTVTRENMIAVGNEVRRKYGNGIWAQRLLDKIELGNNYVVEGFRNSGEIEVFRKIKGFFLLGVASGRKNRFNWIIKRGKQGDPKSMEEFKQLETKDFLQADTAGQQNALCFSMADRYVTNESSIEDLEKQVSQVLKELGL